MRRLRRSSALSSWLHTFWHQPRHAGWHRQGDPRENDVRERGSGTLWVVVAVALLTTFALSAAAIGGAVVTRHRAGSAADFAALAGADALASGGADPCGAARRVAVRYGAVLTRCTTTGMVVDVVVELSAGGLVGPGRVATVRARAGPP